MNYHWSPWASVHGQESPGSRVYFQRLCVTEIDRELNFYALRPSLSTAADFSTQVLTLGITRSMFTFPWALLFLCVQRMYMCSQSQKELQASYIYTHIYIYNQCIRVFCYCHDHQENLPRSTSLLVDNIPISQSDCIFRIKVELNKILPSQSFPSDFSS